MKKIEIQGLGVFIEIYCKKDNMTENEIVKEAAKALTREVMRREGNVK